MSKIIDITNQQFGDLIALYSTKKNNRFAWHCKCICGNEIDVDSGNLRNGKTTSCGCKRKEKISKAITKNIIGQQFGKLIVLEQTSERQCGAIIWKCKCECGTIAYVSTGNLKSGHTKSCGCERFNNGVNLQLNLLNQKFGKLLVIKKLPAENGESKWLCQCDCGNKIPAIGWHLTTGVKQSCGCLKSKGEMKISQLLQKNNIPYVMEKTFDTCRSPLTGQKLRFDFYVNNSYLIEYDGEQHFIARNSGWSTDEQLQKTQLYDSIKDQWCKDNNIPLIRIKYTQFNNLNIKDLILEDDLID